MASGGEAGSAPLAAAPGAAVGEFATAAAVSAALAASVGVGGGRGAHPTSWLELGGVTVLVAHAGGEVALLAPPAGWCDVRGTGPPGARAGAVDAPAHAQTGRWPQATILLAGAAAAAPRAGAAAAAAAASVRPLFSVAARVNVGLGLDVAWTGGTATDADPDPDVRTMTVPAMTLNAIAAAAREQRVGGRVAVSSVGVGRWRAPWAAGPAALASGGGGDGRQTVAFWPSVAAGGGGGVAWLPVGDSAGTGGDVGAPDSEGAGSAMGVVSGVAPLAVRPTAAGGVAVVGGPDGRWWVARRPNSDGPPAARGLAATTPLVADDIFADSSAVAAPSGAGCWAAAACARPGGLAVRVVPLDDDADVACGRSLAAAALWARAEGARTGCFVAVLRSRLATWSNAVRRGVDNATVLRAAAARLIPVIVCVRTLDAALGSDPCGSLWLEGVRLAVLAGLGTDDDALAFATASSSPSALPLRGPHRSLAALAERARDARTRLHLRAAARTLGDAIEGPGAPGGHGARPGARRLALSGWPDRALGLVRAVVDASAAATAVADSSSSDAPIAGVVTPAADVTACPHARQAVASVGGGGLALCAYGLGAVKAKEADAKREAAEAAAVAAGLVASARVSGDTAAQTEAEVGERVAAEKAEVARSAAASARKSEAIIAGKAELLRGQIAAWATVSKKAAAEAVVAAEATRAAAEATRPASDDGDDPAAALAEALRPGSSWRPASRVSIPDPSLDAWAVLADGRAALRALSYAAPVVIPLEGRGAARLVSASGAAPPPGLGARAAAALALSDDDAEEDDDADDSAAARSLPSDGALLPGAWGRVVGAGTGAAAIVLARRPPTRPRCAALPPGPAARATAACHLASAAAIAGVRDAPCPSPAPCGVVDTAGVWSGGRGPRPAVVLDLPLTDPAGGKKRPPPPGDPLICATCGALARAPPPPASGPPRQDLGGADALDPHWGGLGAGAWVAWGGAGGAG